jgi:hypothetical protein
MANAADLLQQGIEAFQAGDRERARELLSQAVSVDPDSEQGWYFLAAAQDDPTLRIDYLNRVLAINPNHARAREVLARLQAAPPSSPPVEPPAQAAEPPVAAPAASEMPAPAPRHAPIRPLSDSAAGAIPGAAPAGEAGFPPPFNISGAPARVTWRSLWDGGFALLRAGFDVLMKKPGVYEDEASLATWWRLWLLVGTVLTITAVISTLNTILTQSRFPGFNLVAVLLALLLAIPIGILTLMGGVYFSHWYARNQGGRVPLYQHAYVLAIVWMPVSLLNGALSLVFSYLGGGLMSLVTLATSIYALLLMVDGIDMLYRFEDSTQKWITAAIMVAGTIITGIIVGIVLGTIAAGVVLPFALA